MTALPYLVISVQPLRVPNRVRVSHARIVKSADDMKEPMMVNKARDAAIMELVSWRRNESEEKRIRRAAKAADVSPAMIRLWLKDGWFMAKYQATRRRLEAGNRPGEQLLMTWESEKQFVSRIVNQTRKDATDYYRSLQAKFLIETPVSRWVRLRQGGMSVGKIRELDPDASGKTETAIYKATKIEAARRHEHLPPGRRGPKPQTKLFA